MPNATTSYSDFLAELRQHKSETKGSIDHVHMRLDDHARKLEGNFTKKDAIEIGKWLVGTIITVGMILASITVLSIKHYSNEAVKPVEREVQDLRVDIATLKAQQPATIKR